LSREVGVVTVVVVDPGAGEAGQAARGQVLQRLARGYEAVLRVGDLVALYLAGGAHRLEEVLGVRAAGTHAERDLGRERPGHGEPEARRPRGVLADPDPVLLGLWQAGVEDRRLSPCGEGLVVRHDAEDRSRQRR